MLSVLVESGISQAVGEAIENRVAGAMQRVGELRSRVADAAYQERQRSAGEHRRGQGARRRIDPVSLCGGNESLHELVVELHLLWVFVCRCFGDGRSAPAGSRDAENLKSLLTQLVVFVVLLDLVKERHALGMQQERVSVS